MCNYSEDLLNCANLVRRGFGDLAEICLWAMKSLRKYLDCSWLESKNILPAEPNKTYFKCRACSEKNLWAVPYRTYPDLWLINLYLHPRDQWRVNCIYNDKESHKTEERKNTDKNTSTKKSRPFWFSPLDFISGKRQMCHESHIWCSSI